MTYCAEFRFHQSGRTTFERFSTELARRLAIIGYGDHVDVVRQWEE